MAAEIFSAATDALGPDGAWYLDMARVLRAKGLWSPDAFAGGYMPPLWPAVIAGLWSVTGESLFTIRIFNLATWVAILPFTYSLARSLIGRTGAWLAVLFFSLHDISHYAKFPQYEILLTFLCVSAVWAWLRGADEGLLWWFVLSGVLWAVAGLMQTRVLPVSLLLLTAVKVGKRSTTWSGPLICVAVAFSLLLPVAYRNWLVHGHFSATAANFGVNLWIGNNPDATGFYMNPPESTTAPISKTTDVYERDRLYAKKATTWIASNPGTFVFRLAPRKLYYLWRLDKPINWALLPFAIAGALGLWRLGHHRRVLALAYPILFVSLLHVVFFGDGRFRFWALPGVHIFAAFTVLRLVAGSSKHALDVESIDALTPHSTD
ncbi:MAG: glycosyltransferase family 39 protein [Candidatus Wallbacteria bacterium]|nr:glycosyltransferase family 39 protein [Candidatus Wallbacteria bacterium]